MGCCEAKLGKEIKNEAENQCGIKKREQQPYEREGKIDKKIAYLFVNTYSDPLQDKAPLPKAEINARRMQNYLISIGFDEEDVHFIYNQSLHFIESQIVEKEILPAVQFSNDSESKTDTVVFLYCSGYAQTKGQKIHFQTADDKDFKIQELVYSISNYQNNICYGFFDCVRGENQVLKNPDLNHQPKSPYYVFQGFVKGLMNTEQNSSTDFFLDYAFESDCQEFSSLLKQYFEREITTDNYLLYDENDLDIKEVQDSKQTFYINLDANVKGDKKKSEIDISFDDYKQFSDYLPYLYKQENAGLYINFKLEYINNYLMMKDRINGQQLNFLKQ